MEALQPPPSVRTSSETDFKAAVLHKGCPTSSLRPHKPLGNGGEVGGSFQGSFGKAVGPLTSNPSFPSLTDASTQPIFMCAYYARDSLRCWIYHGEQERGGLASKQLTASSSFIHSFTYLFLINLCFGCAMRHVRS